MPSTTVSKSTAAKPARKTRTRRTAPPKKVAPAKTVAKTVKAKPVQQNTVTTKTIVSNKVVAQKTEFTKPSAELISFSAYRQDWANRWSIHHFEMQELVKDLTKFVEFVTPYHNDMVKNHDSLVKRVKDLDLKLNF